MTVRSRKWSPVSGTGCYLSLTVTSLPLALSSDVAAFKLRSVLWWQQEIHQGSWTLTSPHHPRQSSLAYCILYHIFDFLKRLHSKGDSVCLKCKVIDWTASRLSGLLCLWPAALSSEKCQCSPKIEANNGDIFTRTAVTLYWKFPKLSAGWGYPNAFLLI